MKVLKLQGRILLCQVLAWDRGESGGTGTTLPPPTPLPLECSEVCSRDRVVCSRDLGGTKARRCLRFEAT